MKYSLFRSFRSDCQFKRNSSFNSELILAALSIWSENIHLWACYECCKKVVSLPIGKEEMVRQINWSEAKVRKIKTICCGGGQESK